LKNSFSDSSEGVEHFFHRQRLAADLALQRVQARQPLLVHRIDVARHDHRQQALAAAEVVVHRRHVRTRLGGDVAHRDPIEAFVREQGLRGLDQPLLGGNLRISRDRAHAPPRLCPPPSLSND
jgi:hypothetical protein